MASELRKQVLEVDDIESEIVEVPQWNVKILVKGMSGKARAQFLRNTAQGDRVDFERFYPELIIATAHDPESGERVFDPADRDALNTKSGAALDLLATRAMQISGIGRASVDEAEQDLGDTPNTGST